MICVVANEFSYQGYFVVFNCTYVSQLVWDSQNCRVVELNTKFIEIKWLIMSENYHNFKEQGLLTPGIGNLQFDFTVSSLEK